MARLLTLAVVAAIGLASGVLLAPPGPAVVVTVTRTVDRDGPRIRPGQPRSQVIGHFGRGARPAEELPCRTWTGPGWAASLCTFPTG